MEAVGGYTETGGASGAWDAGYGDTASFAPSPPGQVRVANLAGREGGKQTPYAGISNLASTDTRSMRSRNNKLNCYGIRGQC